MKDGMYAFHPLGGGRRTVLLSVYMLVAKRVASTDDLTAVLTVEQTGTYKVVRKE